MKNILLDERIDEKCLRALAVRGYCPILLPKDPCLGDAVCSHPDTLLFKHGNTVFTTADYCDAAAYVFSDMRERNPDIRLHFTSDVRGQKFPEDCKMNALVMGDMLFARLSSLSPSLLDYARDAGLRLVDTPQGYPACTVLSLGDSHAVTADPGMAKILSLSGVRVSLISNGGIELPPHEYGFIGGCAGVDGDKVYFFGDLDLHPDSLTVRRAIEEAGFSAVSLSDGPLRDLGGMIFF